VVDEAASRGSHLIVTYHPTPFRGTKRVVRSDPVGRVMLKCFRSGMAVYSTHTALDSVPGGVNDWLVNGLGSGTVVPAMPDVDATIEGAGMGRVLTLGASSSAGGAGAGAGAGAGVEASDGSRTMLSDVIARAKQHLKLDHVRVAIAMERLATAQATATSVMEAAASTPVNTIAVCAGSGASVLGGVDADVWVTGMMVQCWGRGGLGSTVA